MGKRGGKRGRGGRGGGGKHGQRERVDYPEIPKENALFEKYYNSLNILSEAELPHFWEALRRELPNSFRFTGSRGHALPVQQLLKTRYIPEITSITYEGRAVAPPSPIPWYPDQLAWQMTTPKQVVRRFPPFSSFQKFLVSETSVGNISRQEVVSMIPPLLLDVRPGMTVLDLCAAPGSKSAQLIEMIHAGEEARVRSSARKIFASEGRELSPDGNEVKLEIENGGLQDDWEDDGRATGLLVANDVDYKRAHLLIHQMKRLNSPNLIVTNHDATQYPSIKLPTDPAVDGSRKNKYLKFDRILADVPCSGDGTPRKNVNVWRDWRPLNALGLHTTQVRILVRSLQMLKVGGQVVYSTCSMNPIENEAVVAAAIDRCGGIEKINILDCSAVLPELKRAPGLKTWKVMDKKGRLWDKWEDIEKFQEEEEGDVDLVIGKVSRGSFAPDESAGVPLERCMRVYPHTHDTGGFFITVLEKKSEIKARPEGERKSEPQNADGPAPPITAALDELESKANGTQPGEHIEALDSLAQPDVDEAEITGDASAAARQNMETVSMEETNPRKHQLDDVADAAAATKKPKFREEIDAVASRGEEDRQVHYPPPPSAPQIIPESEPPLQSAVNPNTGKQKKVQNFEEPFKYLDPNHEELEKIYSFYSLHPRFPRDRFMVRNALALPAKTIYYTTTLARDILRENEGKGLKFVHCGVKMFVKQDVQSPEVCRWRIQTDGLPLIESWVGDDRIIRLNSRKTFRNLLVEMFPKVTGDSWHDLGEIGERARDVVMGCCVLRIEQGMGDDSFKERMVLPIWRSRHSLNLMLPKEDRKAMLLRLYNDNTPLQDHSKDRFNKTNGEAEAQIEMAPSEVKEKRQVALNEEAEEELSVDEEDGGVALESGDIEQEAELEVEMQVGTKDEEDVKQELEDSL